MPKVVFIGYPLGVAQGLRTQVNKVVQALGLGDEAITEITLDHETRSCDGQDRVMPYIQVCSSDPDEIGDIMKGFVKAGIFEDTECLLLDGFTSGTDMRFRTRIPLEDLGCTT